jgi:hypothetical protein
MELAELRQRIRVWKAGTGGVPSPGVARSAPEPPVAAERGRAAGAKGGARPMAAAAALDDELDEKPPDTAEVDISEVEPLDEVMDTDSYEAVAAPVEAARHEEEFDIDAGPLEGEAGAGGGMSPEAAAAVARLGIEPPEGESTAEIPFPTGGPRSGGKGAG